MAPLPCDRVTKSLPFAVTGLDHAGPLYFVDYPKHKFYVLLFTCGVVRALHIELVNSLSSDRQRVHGIYIRWYLGKQELFETNLKVATALDQIECIKSFELPRYKYHDPVCALINRISD